MLHMTEKREKGGTGGKRVDQTEPLTFTKTHKPPSSVQAKSL